MCWVFNTDPSFTHYFIFLDSPPPSHFFWPYLYVPADTFCDIFRLFGSPHRIRFVFGVRSWSWRPFEHLLRPLWHVVIARKWRTTMRLYVLCFFVVFVSSKHQQTTYIMGVFYFLFMNSDMHSHCCKCGKQKRNLPARTRAKLHTAPAKLRGKLEGLRSSF